MELLVYLNKSIHRLEELGVVDIRISEPEAQTTQPVLETPRISELPTGVPTTQLVLETPRTSGLPTGVPTTQLVPEPLLLVVYPRNITAVEGEEVHLVSLVLPSSTLLLDLVWSRRDGKPLPSNARTVQHGINSVLKIVDVNRGDAGTYRVTAIGELGESLHLDVELSVTALGTFTLVVLATVKQDAVCGRCNV